jgi:hypothetical protein
VIEYDSSNTELLEGGGGGGRIPEGHKSETCDKKNVQTLNVNQQGGEEKRFPELQLPNFLRAQTGKVKLSLRLG